MTRYTPLTAALLASSALVSAAQADVTPQQVWDATRDMMLIGPGTEMTVGSETTEGDSLVLRDVVVTSDVETTEEMFGQTYTSRSHSEATYTEMRFTDNGDGTVTVVYPETIPMVISGEEHDEPYGLKLTLKWSDYGYLVSGSPEEMRHEVDGGAMILSLDELTEGKASVTGPTALTARNFSGWMVHRAGDPIGLDMDMTIDELAFTLAVENTEGDRFDGGGTVNGLKVAGEMTLPAVIKPASDAYPEGLAIDIAYELGNAAYEFDMTGPDGEGRIEATVAGSDMRMVLNEGEVRYDGMARDAGVNLTVPGMPFPVQASIAEYGIGFGMPLATAEAPQPANLKIILDSVSVNEEIWQMFDPMGTLPHDPATVRVALSGMVEMLADLTTPEGADADVPGLPVSAQIDELTIDAVGLKADGSGSVEFDHDDTTSYDGMPAPVGTLTFNVEGANGLIDNLIKMGFVPEDQAMMARMMLGMFAKPTGEDAMSSEIEFREGGAIFANGQRLK